jgi:hypothetical protein
MISISELCASPLMSDAIENTATPTRNRRRLPKKSAARPPSSRKPPNISV